METVFWASVLVVAYVYVGYPLLLAAWAALAPRPIRKRVASDRGRWPSVSVIVAVRDEAARLHERVANLLRQRYPGPLEIIVVSDGSTDAPDRALGGLAREHIRLLEIPRGGKPAALNAGVAAASGEILVFADARQRFTEDAVLNLAAAFADPAVGGATGELVLDSEMDPGAPETTVGEGVGLYWRYEKWLRRRESRIHSTLGATGAIYALRRELWTPLPPETLLDDVLTPMRVVLSGKRIVYEERARAFDRASRDGSVEARRKTRTLAGNYQILGLEPRILIPFVNPVWLQYVSHKLGRLLVPWALLAAFITSAVMAPAHWGYAVALILQLGFYGLAALGGWIDSRERNRRAGAEDQLLDERHASGVRARAHLPRMSGGNG